MVARVSWWRGPRAKHSNKKPWFLVGGSAGLGGACALASPTLHPFPVRALGYEGGGNKAGDNLL